jgi:hypothetical protein
MRRLRHWRPGRRAGWSLRSAEDLVLFSLVKARELWSLATSILSIDLDQTRNEKLLLLVSLSLPVIRLPQRNDEAGVAGPFSASRCDMGSSKGFDMCEVVEVPRLANGESAVGVLLGLVHPHTPRLPYGDYDNSRLVAIGAARLTRGWNRRMLGDADVRNIGLEHCMKSVTSCVGKVADGPRG